jgi:outer membrane protein assembly factor BamB
MPRWVGAFGLAVLITGIAGAGEWPQFRGPGGRAVSDETGLPVTWTATEGLRWKVELPGRGLSAAVVAGGRVYVTASSGYRDRRLHVLCFDEGTGARRWERQFAATGSTLCHPKTCMAAQTPVTDGKAVYALFATGDLAALDRDGNLLWYRSLVGDYPEVTNQVGMAASPLLHKDTLLLPLENVGDSFAAGVDVTTGKTRWKKQRLRDINWVSPALVDAGGRTDAVFATSQEVTAYDPETGQVRWTTTDIQPSSIRSLTAVDGLVIVPGQEPRGETVALRPGPEGAAPEVVWRTRKLNSAYASPVVYRGRVYSINDLTGVHCADARTGELLWQKRIKGPFSASPVAGDGKLYAVNEEGVTTVVQLGDEPRVLSTNPVGETVLATPAVANGAIYLRSDKHLFCVGRKAEK